MGTHGGGVDKQDIEAEFALTTAPKMRVVFVGGKAVMMLTCLVDTTYGGVCRMP